MTDTLETVPQESKTARKDQKAQKDQTETPLESLASISAVLVIGLFVMTFVFQNFEIPSASMVKTLLIGDHVLVDRISLAPPAKWDPLTFYRDIHHGDIIVFLKPNPETPDLYLVKRAVGLPGDHIHLHHGILYVNGVAQNEPYAGMPVDSPYSSNQYIPYRDDFPEDVPGIQEEATANHAALWAIDLPNHIVDGDLVVPPGKVFAMGDNRTESLDSRFWGFVPRENIVGRPMFVYWSFNTPANQIDKQSPSERLGFVVHILTHFFNETRWSRTFHRIQ